MAYKCKKCGSTDIKYFGEMKRVEVEAVLNKEQIAWGDKEEKTGKHLLVCMNPECNHIGYVSDFDVTGE